MKRKHTPDNESQSKRARTSLPTRKRKRVEDNEEQVKRIKSSHNVVENEVLEVNTYIEYIDEESQAILEAAKYVIETTTPKWVY